MNSQIVSASVADRDQQRHELMPQDDLQRPAIKIDDRLETTLRKPIQPTLLLLRLMLAAIRAHHRRQRQRDNRRHDDRHAQRHREFAEQPPDDVAHEQQRNQHRDQRNAQRNDGESDLLRPFSAAASGASPSSM